MTQLIYIIMYQNLTIVIPPQTVFVGGYTVFMLSVRSKVRSSDRVSVTFCFLEESLTEFHQILQTNSYVQGKYY